MSHRTNSIDNKRLAIDLKALRQLVWERNGERTLEVDSSSGDYPRWIDTSVMLADPLTKTMDSERLDQAMTTGYMDLRPTKESIMIKERNRIWRQNARAAKNASKEE